MRLNLRSVSIAAIVILSAVSSVSCTPEEVATYLTLNPTEQAAVHTAIAEQSAVTARPTGQPGGFLACVRRRESGGNYSAENPTSTASGAYQFLDSSWRTLSARAGYGGYGGHAAYAPAWVQDAVAVWTVENIGRSPWYSASKPC